MKKPRITLICCSSSGKSGQIGIGVFAPNDPDGFVEICVHDKVFAECEIKTKRRKRLRWMSKFSGPSVVEEKATDRRKGLWMRCWVAPSLCQNSHFAALISHDFYRYDVDIPMSPPPSPVPLHPPSPIASLLALTLEAQKLPPKLHVGHVILPDECLCCSRGSNCHL